MSEILSKEEKAAMRALAAERRKKFTPEEHAAEVREKIAAMAPADRALGEAVYRIVMAAAPELEPKTFYGMPSFTRNGKVVCFFQDAGKFKVRYSTLGFQDAASLDDGAMWPTSFALTEMTPAVEARITELVRRAVGTV
jgi:uncharacterized protein YdhG (YjbR/CyaY superfamily)